MFTVWTNGCFDILHRGHIELFKFASENLGGELVVGLDSDERVRELKGGDRPRNTLEDRLAVVSSIQYVSRVFTFNSNKELEDLVRQVSPKYMVVGSDYKIEEVIGSQFCGEVLLFKKLEGYSSSNYLK